MSEQELSQKLSNSIYINGRKQIIDMLKIMPAEDKLKLLRNIEARDSVMAKDLHEKSMNFKSIETLSDQNLKHLLSYVNPKIIGIALKFSSREFQRRALSLVQRQDAEQAYDTMMNSFDNERENIERAQRKIIETLIGLHRKQVLNI